MIRKKKYKPKAKPVLQFRVEHRLYRELKRLASKEGISISAVANRWLSMHLATSDFIDFMSPKYIVGPFVQPKDDEASA